MCVCVGGWGLTPEELADGMSRFGQTPEQRLLAVGVRRPGELEL